MANPELGLKRVCVACNTKFYDLTKIPAICPKCGTEQPPDQPKLKRPAGNVAEDKQRPKKPAAGEESEIDTEAAEDEVDEDVLEDTSDLEDDDTAIGGDIEVETEGNEDER